MLSRLHRQPKHLLDFLLAELGTSGSVDGNSQLIIKGRFQQKQIENVLRRYIKEYVTCHTCRSPDTILQKDTRLFFLQCETCGSRCSVASIKSGFQVMFCLHSFSIYSLTVFLELLNYVHFLSTGRHWKTSCHPSQNNLKLPWCSQFYLHCLHQCMTCHIWVKVLHHNSVLSGFLKIIIYFVCQNIISPFYTSVETVVVVC